MKFSDAMVIVGAGEAGVAAAVELRKRGWTDGIILIGSEASLPYERPPLSKSTLTDAEEPTPKLLLSIERLKNLAIDYRPGQWVKAIQRTTKAVTLSDGEKIAYHRLLLATGARPRSVQIPMDPGCRVLTLRTYSDALALRENLTPGKRVVIIGGGFIGLEIAASAIARRAAVTVIEAGPRLLMRGVPPDISAYLTEKHKCAGVRVELNAAIEQVSLADTGAAVTLRGGQRHLADVIVVGVGAVPNVELALEAGLNVDNGIAADSTLATSDPSIFAAGDCCSFEHALYNRRVRLEVWRNAWQQGVTAAANMLGECLAFECVPWFWSDQYDEVLQVAGIITDEDQLIRRDLGANGSLWFYLSGTGRLMAACGVGPLQSISREIRTAEAMIAARAVPIVASLADPNVALKKLI